MVTEPQVAERCVKCGISLQNPNKVVDPLCPKCFNAAVKAAKKGSGFAGFLAIVVLAFVIGGAVTGVKALVRLAEGKPAISNTNTGDYCTRLWEQHKNDPGNLNLTEVEYVNTCHASMKWVQKAYEHQQQANNDHQP